MDNKPSFDRSIFIPIIIGLVSVLGICLVLFVARLGAARGTVQSGVTQTPMKYQYLATEPGIALPTDAPPATEIPTLAIVNFPPTPTGTIVPTLIIASIATNTPVTASPTALALSVTYDDADFKFNYTGNWIGQSGVSGTHEKTLHISNTIGDSVQLSFVGQKILFNYQAGPSLGTVAIILDSADFTLDQSANDTKIVAWESPVLSLSSHTITITHISGGSVNVDSAAVLDLSTPTPTATATP